ncbi:hypothetical protein LguiB_013387 [Lonicera macranthoides]
MQRNSWRSSVLRNHEFLVELILWNPTTGDYKALPNVQLSDHDRIQTVGFGYDSLTDDFKLVMVRITNCNRSCRYRVDLYSLKTNAWKKIRVVPDQFDPHLEEFTELLLPNEIRKESRKHVVELGGYLGVYYRTRPRNLETLIWTMKEDDSKKQKWTRLMPLPGHRWRPFCYLENGKVLSYKREHNFFMMFGVFDPKEINPKGFMKYPIHRVIGFGARLVKYTESLVSLNSRRAYAFPFEENELSKVNMFGLYERSAFAHPMPVYVGQELKDANS